MGYIRCRDSGERPIIIEAARKSGATSIYIYKLALRVVAQVAILILALL